MPNHQKHRGAHSDDARLFHPRWLTTLREAVADLSWLVSRGYSEASSAKLVGDHFRLQKRQRMAFRRCACSEESSQIRLQKEVGIEALRGLPVSIDGYNILISVESLLAGAFLFKGKDQAIRDLASLHSTYRKVEETVPALHLIGASLEKAGVTQVHWYLDAPIANSGRLSSLMREIAEANTWNWEISLSFNPDKTLSSCKHPILSSDAWVIERSEAWFNLLAYLFDEGEGGQGYPAHLVVLG